MKELADRIAERVVETENGCKEWVGAKTPRGYGMISANGKYQYIHRLIWESNFGPIPKGMQICHHCDNPPCGNIDHLFMGTPADNTADMIRKGRQSRGLKRQLQLLRHSPLNAIDIVAIRERYRAGERAKIILEDYPVSLAVIYNVINGKTCGLINPELISTIGMPKGSRHHDTSLVENDVIDIRQRVKNGEKQAELAREYKLDRSSMSRIVNRLSWKHV